MTDSLKGLFTSKKFIAAIVSVIVWLVGKFGGHLDDQTLLGIVSPLWLFIVGQAVADHGKEAAQINADASVEVAATNAAAAANAVPGVTEAKVANMIAMHHAAVMQQTSESLRTPPPVTP